MLTSGPEFLTALALGRRYLGKTNVDSAAILHDVILHTCKHRGNLDIFLPTLCAEFSDQFFREATTTSLAQHLKILLEQGGRVRVLIWNEFSDTLVAPSIRELARSYPDDRLAIEYSGTSKGWVKPNGENELVAFAISPKVLANNSIVFLDNSWGPQFASPAPPEVEGNYESLGCFEDLNKIELRHIPDLSSFFERLYTAAIDEDENGTNS